MRGQNDAADSTTNDEADVTFVTVRPGDPLRKRAVPHHTMVERIVGRNDIEGWNRIGGGDRLSVPRS